MVELEKASRAAPSSVRSHKGAAIAVSQPHRSLDLRRNVTGVWGRRPPGVRLLGGGELLPGQVLEKGRERAIDDLRQVSIWNGVSEEILREPEFLARPGARREADLISVRRERSDESTACRGR
jgi:hypothetical protein